jgi:hypothetical protein
MEILPIHEVRRARLRQLLHEHGGPAALARRIGLFQASYLTQLAGPTPTRTISEHTARRIEQALLLPEAWLDSPPAEDEVLPAQASPPTFRPTDGLAPPPLHEPALLRVLQALHAAQLKAGVTLAPARYARLAVVLYELAYPNKPLDDTLVRQLVTFAAV